MKTYSLSLRIMHWVVALFIISQLSVGLWMSDLPNTDPNKMFYYEMHKSFGVVVLMLVCIRLISRMASVIPSYKNIKIKAYEIKLAHAGHFLLYLLMFTLPISGYCMSNLSGHPVDLFGYPVVDILPTKMHGTPAGLFHTAHVYGGYMLLTLIVLHILGSAKHYLIDKENLVKRMWF